MDALSSRALLLARQEAQAVRSRVSCLNEHEVIAVRGTSCARCGGTLVPVHHLAQMDALLRWVTGRALSGRRV